MPDSRRMKLPGQRTCPISQSLNCLNECFPYFCGGRTPVSNTRSDTVKSFQHGIIWLSLRRIRPQKQRTSAGEPMNYFALQAIAERGLKGNNKIQNALVLYL